MRSDLNLGGSEYLSLEINRENRELLSVGSLLFLEGAQGEEREKRHASPSHHMLQDNTYILRRVGNISEQLP